METVEELESGLYEEFNHIKEENFLNNSKYMKILGDQDSLRKSDKKVVFVDEDDNEYEPIDRTVGADRGKFIIIYHHLCMF